MIGIDFGTAFARAARFNPLTKVTELVPNPDGELRTPSAAYFGPADVVVGVSALRMVTIDGERERVVIGAKRLLGQLTAIPFVDRKLHPAGVVAEVIRHLVVNTAETLHEPVRRAVLTHPADFTPAELSALQHAAQRAGLEEVSLLAEPSAAVVGYEQTGRKAGDTVLVCDLGAGRFTAVALVRTEDGSFRPLTSPRTRRVGGYDFDRFLFGLCERETLERRQQPLNPEASDAAFLALQDCKEELSRRDQAEFAGRLADGAEFRWSVSRSAFEGLIRAEVEEMAKLARAAYDEAAGRHPPAETVLLVGGSARIPLVRSLLTASLPVAPIRWPQQDIAVALGAGRAAFNLWGGNGPPPRVRVEQTTTLAELIHRVAEREAEEEAQMSQQNEQRREGSRKKVLDAFVVKAAGLEQKYVRLRGVLADRLAQRDYPQAQDAVCALRMLREEDPEVVKAQTFLDTRCEKNGEVRSVAIGATVFGLSIAKDGKLGWVARADGHLGLFDMTSGQVLKNLPGHGNAVTCVDWNQVLPQLATGSLDATIRIWDPEKHTQIASWSNQCGVQGVKFLPDGKQLVAVGEDGKVRLWSPSAPSTPVVTFEGHTKRVFTVQVSPDARFLTTASEDGTVRVWDIERGRELRRMTGHRGWVGCSRFFPGGRLVVSGGADSTLRVWDTETGREMARWEGHTDAVRAVDFTQDGRYAVSAGFDKTVRVWDVASGWCLRTFTGHTNQIFCVAVAPDGKHALTGSSDNTVRLWSLGICE